MYKFPSIKMAQNQNCGHLQAFPQKHIQNSRLEKYCLIGNKTNQFTLFRANTHLT